MEMPNRIRRFLTRVQWELKYPYVCTADNTPENVNWALSGASVPVERSRRLYCFKTERERSRFLGIVQDGSLTSWDQII